MRVNYSQGAKWKAIVLNMLTRGRYRVRKNFALGSDVQII